MFLENELLYGTAFDMSDEAMKDDFLIPIGKAKIEREGKDVTLVAHSMSVQRCLEAAQQLQTDGVSAEVRRILKHSTSECGLSEEPFWSPPLCS